MDSTLPVIDNFMSLSNLIDNIEVNILSDNDIENDVLNDDDIVVNILNDDDIEDDILSDDDIEDDTCGGPCVTEITIRVVNLIPSKLDNIPNLRHN